MMHTNWTRRVSGACLGVLGLVAIAVAQESGLTLAVVKSSDLQFVRMYNGTFQANVVGDIAKAGPYAVRTKFPAGLRIPPHFHPEDRIVLVMSGTLYVGFGDRFDEAALTPLPAGAVFTEPARRPHFTWAKDDEVILHVTGVGPTATTWTDPQPGQKK